VYKVLPADNSTTSEELIAAALERCSIIDDPKRYYICVQCKGTEGECIYMREMVIEADCSKKIVECTRYFDP
jgi:hypothetical protein